MDGRKVWLHNLAQSPKVHEWARACDPDTFSGMSRVQTRNTTYLFRNGSCFAVTHSDRSRGPSSELVGIKLVGWLFADGPDPRLSRTWRPGARAVLWGVESASNGQPIALTSPTVGYTLFTHAAHAGPTEDGQGSDRTSHVTMTRAHQHSMPLSNISLVGSVKRAI